MKREESVNHFLEIADAKSIDDLNCEQLACLYDYAFKDSPASAMTIYRESNEKEREEFKNALLGAMKGEIEICLYETNAEGVYDEKNKEYFDFCWRHTDWYEVTSRT